MFAAILTLLTQAAFPIVEVGTPPPALADISDLTVSYYSVSGANPRAIRQSMNQRRPRDPRTAEPFDGRTDVAYRWSAPGRQGGGCDTAKAEFVHKVSVILPRLEDAGRLSSAEKTEWDEYMARLVAHERNHALIGVRGGEEVEKQVRSAVDCAAASAAAKAVSDRVAAAHIEYDRRTDHGALEGAVYPNGPTAGPRRGRNR